MTTYISNTPLGLFFLGRWGMGKVFFGKVSQQVLPNYHFACIEITAIRAIAIVLTTTEAMHFTKPKHVLLQGIIINIGKF